MKWVTPFAMLLAVLATAVVGVCELAEVRHHEYRVWGLERRRAAAERRILRLGAAARAARTPRVLLGTDPDALPRAGDPWAVDDLAPGRFEDLGPPAADADPAALEARR
jgi:hypothetical protein